MLPEAGMHLRRAANLRRLLTWHSKGWRSGCCTQAGGGAAGND